MRRTSVSRPHRLICPACGYGALHPRGPLSRSAYYCESCWCSFGGAIVGTLKQIAALPDAVGKHACEECGHPEDALSARRDVSLPKKSCWDRRDRRDREGRAGLVEDYS